MRQQLRPPFGWPQLRCACVLATVAMYVCVFKNHVGKKKGKEKKEKKRRGAQYGYRTRELRLDSLMYSPPTPQRHELGIAKKKGTYIQRTPPPMEKKKKKKKREKKEEVPSTGIELTNSDLIV